MTEVEVDLHPGPEGKRLMAEDADGIGTRNVVAGITVQFQFHPMTPDPIMLHQVSLGQGRDLDLKALAEDPAPVIRIDTERGKPGLLVR